MTRNVLVSVGVVLALATGAGAQPPPPRGPAEVITRSRETREAEDRAEAIRAPEGLERDDLGAAEEPGAEPQGEAADRAGAMESPHGATPEEEAALEAHAARALEGPQVASAEPSTEVPSGEIRVVVLELDGEPAQGAPVRLGTMGAAGDRDSKSARTDASGEAWFRDLPTGSAQAYRVSVPHEGAKYSSAPFRLEPDRGHLVRVMRIPVTRDDGAVLQWFGGTFIEIRPDRRIHVVQQTDLVNLGRETYVTPEGGLQIPLPRGFTAFQSQQVMTDQRFVPNDRGFRLEGSLPPGRVQLTWAFDLPIDGDGVTLAQRMPFRTYQYVVASEYAQGLELEVDGFPPAQRADDQGRAHLATRVARTPDEEPLEQLRVNLRGIPGPGPGRMIAVVFALGFLGLALYLARRPRGGGRERAALRDERRRELLEDARELEVAFAREEVGPKFHERRRREIIDELAILLGTERGEAAAPSKAPPPDR